MVLHGVRLVDSGNKLTTLLRIATHMRAANALLNPLLVVGAPAEAGIQGVLEDLTNVITGNSGNNVIDGGAGTDTMIGGNGNDSYYVDNYGDMVTEVAKSPS